MVGDDNIGPPAFTLNPLQDSGSTPQAPSQLDELLHRDGIAPPFGVNSGPFDCRLQFIDALAESLSLSKRIHQGLATSSEAGVDDLPEPLVVEFLPEGSRTPRQAHNGALHFRYRTKGTRRNLEQRPHFAEGGRAHTPKIPDDSSYE